MQSKRLRRGLMAGAMCCVGAAMPAGAQTTYLYQGSGTQTPQSQGWLSYYALGGTPTETSAAGTTTFDTTSSSAIEGGFSNYTVAQTMVNPSFPALNPAGSGFSVSFDLQINSETHGADDNRAGFDVIVLGSDKKGVELGFWENDIWAQQLSSDVFTRDPGEDADTQLGATLSTLSPTHYTLSIEGGNYTLSAGTTNPVTLLSGATHDYSSYTGPGPYSLANYVFIGDDTTDASASETFSSLAVTVPEPGVATALAIFAGGSLCRRRRV